MVMVAEEDGMSYKLSENILLNYWAWVSSLELEANSIRNELESWLAKDIKRYYGSDSTGVLDRTKRAILVSSPTFKKVMLNGRWIDL